MFAGLFAGLFSFALTCALYHVRPRLLKQASRPKSQQPLPPSPMMTAATALYTAVASRLGVQLLPPKQHYTPRVTFSVTTGHSSIASTTKDCAKHCIYFRPEDSWKTALGGVVFELYEPTATIVRVYRYELEGESKTSIMVTGPDAVEPEDGVSEFD